jgi:hypothetical protein
MLMMLKLILSISGNCVCNLKRNDNFLFILTLTIGLLQILNTFHTSFLIILNQILKTFHTSVTPSDMVT